MRNKLGKSLMISTYTVDPSSAREGARRMFENASTERTTTQINVFPEVGASKLTIENLMEARALLERKPEPSWTHVRVNNRKSLDKEWERYAAILNQSPSDPPSMFMGMEIKIDPIIPDGFVAFDFPDRVDLFNLETREMVTFKR